MSNDLDQIQESFWEQVFSQYSGYILIELVISWGEKMIYQLITYCFIVYVFCGSPNAAIQKNLIKASWE